MSQTMPSSGEPGAACSARSAAADDIASTSWIAIEACSSNPSLRSVEITSDVASRATSQSRTSPGGCNAAPRRIATFRTRGSWQRKSTTSSRIPPGTTSLRCMITASTGKLQEPGEADGSQLAQADSADGVVRALGQHQGRPAARRQHVLDQVQLVDLPPDPFRGRYRL